MTERPRIHNASFDRESGEIVVTVNRQLRGKLDVIPVRPTDAVKLIEKLAAAVLAHNERGGNA